MWITSCVESLLDFCEIITNRINKVEPTVMINLDFQKVFNSILQVLKQNWNVWLGEYTGVDCILVD